MIKVHGFCQKNGEIGQAGSYIARFKKVIFSWLKFNDICLQLTVNISGKNETPTIVNERVPSKDERSKTLKKSITRVRVAIAIMAFSHLRPESLGDYEGTEDLRLDDLKEPKLSDEIQFDKILATVMEKSRLDSILAGKSIIILDEVDFLQDYDVLYHLSRHTRANLILPTQKVCWYKDMNDEVVKSSLQPDHVVFHEYSSDEIREILKMRADESLNKYDPDSLGLLSALLVRGYRNDARIGIKALEILGRANKWSEEAVREALMQAYVEAELEITRNLGERDLLIFASLIEN